VHTRGRGVRWGARVKSWLIRSRRLTRDARNCGLKPETISARDLRVARATARSRVARHELAAAVLTRARGADGPAVELDDPAARSR